VKNKEGNFCKIANKKEVIMKRSFIREILESIDEETISFAGGLPNKALFPLQQLQKASNTIFNNPKVLQYSLSNGIKSLRQKIAKQYNQEGFESTEDNILITTGSQQAMYIIAKYFQSKAITIEEPSYLGAMNIFRLNALKMSGVKLEEDGIDLNAFEESFKSTQLAYLIPDFQNPFSSTYSDEKREEVAKIVQKYDGILIEDAPYRELYFDKKHPTISALIPHQSFHLGSFSKTLAPSLRIGWIRASKELIQSLLIIKESIDLHSCGISQYILDEYLNDESQYTKHLETLRREYQAKMNFFTQTLEEILPEFKFTKPQGGMFIYGNLEGIDSFALVQKCIQNKVVYVPGSEFYIEKRVNGEIRFNYSHSNFEAITKGIGLIKNSL
ncbi:MAG: PLP-dependent aminotransferase family protein, partial [Arcobacteraceae bacterium]